MRIYTAPTEKRRIKHVKLLGGSTYSLEKGLDENGKFVQRTVICPPSESPTKGLSYQDFELDPIIAAGALSQLKQVASIQSSPLQTIDSLDKQAEYLTTLKSTEV